MVSEKAATIITCYNEVEYIERAIESCLNQKTSYEHEVIVIQQGDNPELREKISKYGVRHYQLPQGSVSLSRNLGRKVSDADYLLYLDADDYSMPTRVQESVGLLKEGYDIVGQCSRSLRRIDDNSNVLKPFRELNEIKKVSPENSRPCDPETIKRYPIIYPSAIAMRRENAVWNERYFYCEDYEFLLRSYLNNLMIKPVCKDFTTKTEDKPKATSAKRSQTMRKIREELGIERVPHKIDSDQVVEMLTEVLRENSDIDRIEEISLVDYVNTFDGVLTSKNTSNSKIIQKSDIENSILERINQRLEKDKLN